MPSILQTCRRRSTSTRNTVRTKGRRRWQNKRIAPPGRSKRTNRFARRCTSPFECSCTSLESPRRCCPFLARTRSRHRSRRRSSGAHPSSSPLLRRSRTSSSHHRSSRTGGPHRRQSRTYPPRTRNRSRRSRSLRSSTRSPRRAGLLRSRGGPRRPHRRGSRAPPRHTHRSIPLHRAREGRGQRRTSSRII
jgi:hypothetical protein